MATHYVVTYIDDNGCEHKQLFLTAEDANGFTKTVLGACVEPVKYDDIDLGSVTTELSGCQLHLYRNGTFATDVDSVAYTSIDELLSLGFSVNIVAVRTFPDGAGVHVIVASDDEEKVKHTALGFIHENVQLGLSGREQLFG